MRAGKDDVESRATIFDIISVGTIIIERKKIRERVKDGEDTSRSSIKSENNFKQT